VFIPTRAGARGSDTLAVIKRHNRLEDKLFETPAMLKVSQHY